MKRYDLLFDPCKPDAAFVERLGFDEVFLARKNSSSPLCASSDASALMKAAQNGAAAVAITDFTIDRKLLARLKENGTVLCMPFAPILSRNGLERAKLLYKAATLLRYAYNKRIEVSFASLAESELYMNSCIQLVELAKLLGATEGQARLGIGDVNRRIGEAIGKG